MYWKLLCDIKAGIDFMIGSDPETLFHVDELTICNVSGPHCHAIPANQSSAFMSWGARSYVILCD